MSYVKTYKGILFIGDLNLTGVRHPRRVDENPVDKAFAKLSEALIYAQRNQLKIFVVGALTFKTFEVAVYSKLISLLRSYDVTVLAAGQAYKRAGSEINQHSSISLLHQGGIIDLIDKPLVQELLLTNAAGGVARIGVVSIPHCGIDCEEKLPEIIDTMAVMDCERYIAITNIKAGNNDRNSELSAELINSLDCDIVALNVDDPEVSLNNDAMSSWAAIEPLFRTMPTHADITPSAWEWCGDKLNRVEISHERHVLGHSNYKAISDEIIIDNSQFIKLLSAEAEKAKQAADEDATNNEMREIILQIEASQEAREIVEKLFIDVSCSARAGYSIQECENSVLMT